MNKPLPSIAETPESLQKQLKRETVPKKRLRLQALYLLASGQVRSRLALAKLLAVHRHTIQTWLQLYEEGGLRMLLTIKKPPGKRPWLTPIVLTNLQERLADVRGFGSYGEVRQYLTQIHKISLAYTLYMPWSGINYRPSSRRAALPSKKKPEEVAQFQATLSTQLQAQISRAQHQGYQQWRLWAQDESRCGLLPSCAAGSPPRCPTPSPLGLPLRESHLYGAVEPLTGESFFLELPILNTQGFQLFLDNQGVLGRKQVKVGKLFCSPLRELSSSYGFIQKTEHEDYTGSVLKVLSVSVLSYCRVRLITPGSALIFTLLCKEGGVERRWDRD